MVALLKDSYIESYWTYYLNLERRLQRTEEYVAFDEVNNKTYSIEYLALLQAISGEVDVVGKAIASHFDHSFDSEKANIQKWGYVVQTYLPEITTLDISFRHEKTLQPWKQWTVEQRISKKGSTYYAYANGCGAPTWWNAYNKVKHARTTIDDGRVNYHLANQKNTVLALAGLFALHRLMLAHLDADAYATIKRSELFVIPGRNDEVRTGVFIDSEGRFTLFTDEDD